MRLVLIISLFTLMSFSCSQSNPEKQQKTMTREEYEEMTIKKNREKLELERMAIKHYIDTSSYMFSSTGSGLHYTVLSRSEERVSIQEGDLLVLDYEIRDLANRLLESSSESGKKKLRYLRDDDLQGLHEGLAYMHLNDEYLFIIPAHLGYGLAGSTTVPSNSILLYKVKIVSIN